MPDASYLTVDLKALEENLLFFNRKVGSVMPMVKANSYGTGGVKLSRFLEKKDDLPYVGVSHVNEGVALRKAGITLPIFVISAPPFEAAKTARYSLSPAVSSLEELEALERAADLEGTQLGIHVHVNTGMNRFGTSPDQALELITKMRKMPHLYLEGVMTHFAGADSLLYDPFSRSQIDLFERFVKALDSPPRWIHAANTAGALRFDLPFCNLARIGAGLFGVGAVSSSLKPALTLETHLVSIAFCPKGESIGYNRAYFLDKDALIGVIPFGYYDGCHRSFAQKGYVHVLGKKAPFVGHICMDFTMIDLTEIPGAAVGTPVTLFDASLRPETVASWGSTDVRELLTGLGPRVRRIFKYPSTPRNDEKKSPERLVVFKVENLI